MTDYLKGYAAASVPGIRLLCKYVVANGPSPRSQIQSALRPADIVPKTDSEGATMPASLEVARDIGLLTTDGSKQDPIWSPGPCLVALESASAVLETADAFRSLILKSLSITASRLASSNKPASDVSIALTWVLSRDPLIQTWWDHRRMESRIKAEGMSKVIDNYSQWNAFRRWLTAFGLGAATRFSGRELMLSVSTASAIRDARIETLRPMPAKEFIGSLLSAVPILGHELLLSRLPVEAKPTWEGTASPAVAQGLLELEAMKELRMLPGDDSEAVVRLAVGKESRAVRSIEWTGQGI
jgi:hypothetical protein